MKEDRQSSDIRDKRAQAVKTAWVLGVIVVAIFAAFVVSAIIGR